MLSKKINRKKGVGVRRRRCSCCIAAAGAVAAASAAARHCLPVFYLYVPTLVCLHPPRLSVPTVALVRPCVPCRLRVPTPAIVHSRLRLHLFVCACVRACSYAAHVCAGWPLFLALVRTRLCLLVCIRLPVCADPHYLVIPIGPPFSLRLCSFGLIHAA